MIFQCSAVSIAVKISNMITEEDEPRRRLTGEHDVDASRAENAENQDKPGRKNLAEPDEKQENRTSKGNMVKCLI